ncbi:MAG: HAD hydrolase-like protein [Dolichospermum sp.]|jgi:phosphoglycolate phosphatase
MLSHTVLFDLDGTLTDPKPGITRCIQYALSELGYKPPDANELLWCIGPPLKSSFSQLLQTSDDTLLEEAILLYRSRFSTIGLFENRLHDIIGAKKNNIASIGVTYGYGSREELETHKADLIADCPKEIPTLLPLI